MNTKTRDPKSTVFYLAKSMTHWQPGKVHTTKRELRKWLMGEFDAKEMNESLDELDKRIDKMARNSIK